MNARLHRKKDITTTIEHAAAMICKTAPEGRPLRYTHQQNPIYIGSSFLCSRHTISVSVVAQGVTGSGRVRAARRGAPETGSALSCLGSREPALAEACGAGPCGP